MSDGPHPLCLSLRNLHTADPEESSYVNTRNYETCYCTLYPVVGTSRCVLIAVTEQLLRLPCVARVSPFDIGVIVFDRFPGGFWSCGIKYDQQPARKGCRARRNMASDADQEYAGPRQ